MSPHRLKFKYFNGCYGKLRHEHALSAIQHAAALSRDRPKIPWHVYVCDFCTGLHVGRWKTFNHVLTEDMEIPMEGADSFVGP